MGKIISIKNSSVSHIKKTISKSNQTNLFLNMLSGCHFGVHPSKYIMFYTAFIRSGYEYACSSLGKISKAELKNINSHANFHLRKAPVLVKSTPINIIYQLAAELSPFLRIEFSTTKELAKTFAFRLSFSFTFAWFVLSTYTSYSRIYFNITIFFTQLSLSVMFPILITNFL